MFALFQAKICIIQMGHKGEITRILEFSMNTLLFVCLKNEILLLFKFTFNYPINVKSYYYSKSYAIIQGQLQIWTEHSTLIFENLKTSREIKKLF